MKSRKQANMTVLHCVKRMINDQGDLFIISFRKFFFVFLWSKDDT